MKNPFSVMIAIASVTSLATAARAADVSLPVSYDWSGFYLGLNAGVAWNNTDIDNFADGPSGPSALATRDFGYTDDDAVFTGGALVGYNWQHESLVLGVEADINYLGFDSESEISESVYSHKLSFQADWFGTLRGRFGFAADNFLFYGTGGLAYGNLEVDSQFARNGTIDNPGSFGWKGSADDVNWGWTLGAGMEYGIDNWSLGVEYLFVDLGDADWNGNYWGDGSYDDLVSEGSVDYQFSVLRATAKLRF